MCSYDDVFSTLPNLSILSGLKILVLHQIESKDLKNLLDQLQSSTSLSSINISILDVSANKTEICLQLFRLSTLKFCKLSFHEYSRIDLPLSIATIKDQSSIEHFIMTNSIFIHELDNLLLYLPRLSRLSLQLSQNNQQTSMIPSKLILNHLNHLSVQIFDLKFDDFKQMMIDIFSNIKFLNFTQNNYPTANRNTFKRYEMGAISKTPSKKLM